MNQQQHQRTNSDSVQNPPQSFQQRSTNTLQQLNEILSKSKYQFPVAQNQVDNKSVALANVAPMAPEASNSKIPATSSSSGKTNLKVNLNRLNPEHIKLMEHSVSEFAKNAPETAKKLGVIRNEMDMFELMKADERTAKRKNPDDGPLCKCSVV